MKSFNKALIVCSFLLTTSTPSLAAVGQPIDGPEQHCYGMSMVGYDSVINSRLGVPPEHALELAAIQRVGGKDVVYQPFLLKVVLDAYLWNQAPHNYAVKVMYQCAQRDVRMRTAGITDESLM
ncbi:MAG: hypothetical protein OEZ43_00855 [Gammaproteobacteria bacterium]|nr:hypothetical protein [Gammaproteobacteria bacterium]